MIFRKAVSVFVIFTFLFSNIAFAIPAKSNIDVAKNTETAINPDSIVVPRDFGLVKSKFNGNSGALVVHIQDAHCNYEAQSNIVKILEGLIKNYRLGLVSVEGADGFIDTSWFKAFPDDEVRREVADYFMKKGEITGPEFLSITTDLAFKLFGAETRSYYIENLNAFTSSYPLKAETEKYFTSIKTVLNRLKGIIYSDDLKTMDARSQDYESKKIQFNDYIRFLQVTAERQKINIRSYENFFRLVSVLIYEKKIDFNVTDKERSLLIDELSKALSKDALQELVGQSISFKSGKIASAEYYHYLKSLAAANNIDLAKKYPNLYNYIIYNSVYSKIENEKLFTDIKNMEIAIREKLFKNDDQRALDKLSRHIDILLGLVNIKLLNGDFEYYQANKKDFTVEYFEDFIKKKTVQYGLAYDISSPTDAVNQSIPKLEDFYSIAMKRDKALVDNTLAAMKKEKQNIAVLVTGGFHSEGIAKLLEKEDVSYMVVCPSITKDVPSPYIEILTNQRTPLENILVGTAHAKEGSVAIPLRTQLSINDEALKNISTKIQGGESLKIIIGEFRKGWVTLTIQGANGLRTPVGSVKITGYINNLRKSTGSALPDTIKQLKKQLNDRCRLLKLPANEVEDLNKLLDETVSLPEFQSLVNQFETKYKERATAKTRKSPGMNAVDVNAKPRTLENAEWMAMNEILKQSIADKTCKIVTAKELGFTELGDFQFVVHYALEARIEKYNKEHGTNLPTDRVHPGRGGAEFQYGLRQGHISSYRFENLMMTNYGKEALRVIGTHELAHIQIVNKESSEAYKQAQKAPGVDEELIVDFRVPGANTRVPYGWLSGQTIRQLLSIIDERRKNNSVYRMEESVLTDAAYGTSARDEIVRLRNDGKNFEAGELTRLVYERRANIDRMKKVFSDIYQGYDVIIISSTTEGEARDQQEKLSKIFENITTSNRALNNKVCVLSVLDASEGNNLIGQNNTWIGALEAFKEWARANKLAETDLAKLQAEGKVKVATYHNGGKAERFSPAGQALNLSRADQLLVGNVSDTNGQPIELNLLLTVILTTACNAVTNNGSTHDVYWANQIEFGTVPSVVRHGYVFNKFAVAVPANPNMKDLFDYGTLIASKDGRILKFLGNKRLTRKDDATGGYIPNPDWQVQYDELMQAAKEGRAYFDYGSFSMSLGMQNALLKYWRDVKKIVDAMSKNEDGRAGISREIDPHMTQTIVPLVNGLMGRESRLNQLPTIAELDSASDKNAILDRAYNTLIGIMSEEYKIVLEDLYKKAGKGDNLQAIYETIEFFIRYKGEVDLMKGFGIIDFGPASHWFAYKRLLDMGNEKFYMLADIIGQNMELEPNGNDLRTPAGILDKIRAEDARRFRNIGDEAVCVFEVNGQKVALSLEQVRNGWEGYGVKIKGSVIQGKAVLLPGSVVVDSVINYSKGQIIATNSYIDSSASPKIEANNSIVLNAVCGKPIVANKEVVADAFRPDIRDDRFAAGHARMRAPIGYDPKPGNKELAAKMSDNVKFGDNRYSFAEIRNMPCDKAANKALEDAARAEVYTQLDISMRERIAPTMTARYQESKKQFSRSTFGEQLVFGTSGIREVVRYLEDIKCYAIAKAIASYFKGMNEPDAVALAADLRPSSPRIIEDIVIGNLDTGRQVVYSGNVPTPAVVNYGMYRSEGAIPSAMVTASHCPVLPESKHQNGIKPNRTTGEVLKEDERLILKHVREFLELEFMMREDQSMFDAQGMRKTEGLSAAQENIVKQALQLLANINDEARAMYINRYIDNFGTIFDQSDEIDFIEHMAVGRKIITDIFTRMGAKFNPQIEQTEWVEGFVMDTEDLQPKIKEAVRAIAANNIKEGKKIKGIFTTDGDSDRPALFTENGEFVYGDKLGYITCEYIRNLKAYQDRNTKFFVAVTATVSNAVIERLKSIGFEVEVVKIGSPYVVKAMEDRRAKGDNVICLGFERNGGFLLGSDITLNNGKILKALPTRDAALPIIAAFHTAKMENRTIDQLFKDRFSGQFASHGWSSLIEAHMTDASVSLEFVRGQLNDTELLEQSGISAEGWVELIKKVMKPVEEALKKNQIEEAIMLTRTAQRGLPDVINGLGITNTSHLRFISEKMNEIFRLKTIFDRYTANMGQAIMRSFSPYDLSIIEVTFNNDGSVSYLTTDNKTHKANQGQIIDGEDFAKHMNEIKTSLENHFKAVNAFSGGIIKIGYLDGVRIFFKNRVQINGQEQEVTEIIHMRPSGNSPQWRIYSEASTQARAEQITAYRFVVYSNIIEEYLENKKGLEGIHIVPRANDKIKETFRDIRRFDQAVTEEPTDWWKSDNWLTWKMIFGAQSEHSAEESVVFGKNNSSVTFTRTTNYNISGDAKWLARSGYTGTTLKRTNSISWDRQKGALTCEEVWSDGRRVSVIYEGPDAWLEIGRGLDKNIPMGKFQNMPFPVMSDNARAYFKQNGIFWLDLFDVSVESEFTGEAPMWKRNFNFEQAQPVTKEQPSMSQRRSPGEYSVSAGNELAMPAEEAAKIVASIFENYATGEEIMNVMFEDLEELQYRSALALVSNELNKRYVAMTPEERNAAWPALERFYAAMSEKALAVEDINVSRGLQIMIGQTIAVQNLIENGIAGAENIRLTANPGEMLKSKDNEGRDRGPSYIAIPENMKPAEKEGGEGIYWRGAEGISKLGPNVLNEMAYAENKPQLDRLVMYTMLHINGFHTTVFLHDRLPGSIQHISTGKGHFQAKQITEVKAVGVLDIKRVTRGEVLQLNDLYNYKGRVAEILAQKVRPGEWARALPGSMDYMVPLTRIAVFNDISVEVNNPALVRTLNPNMMQIVENDEVTEQTTVEGTVKAISVINHLVKLDKVANNIVVNINGNPTIVANNGAPQITQIGQYSDMYNVLEMFFKANMTESAGSSPAIQKLIEQLTLGKNARLQEILNTLRLETSNITEYVKALEALNNIIQEGKRIDQVTLLKTDKEGYTWGQPIAVNLILELLGAVTPADKTALAKKLLARQYGKPENEIDNEVIGELWEGAGAIDAGTGRLLPVEILGVFWPNEVYGERHMLEVGRDSGITNKRLASAKVLSIQIHDFDEMIRPHKDGWAYIGLKNTMTGDQLVNALRAGDRSIFNRVPAKQGQVYIVPAFTIHAYDEGTFVAEAKAVSASEDARRTISFGDWLKLNEEEMARVTKITSENKALEAAILIDKEKLLRRNKDLLMMVKEDEKGNITGIDDEKINKILKTLEENGSLNKAIPEAFEFPSILASEAATQKVARAEIMGLAKGLVSARYTIATGASIGSRTLVPPATYHVLFVEKGKVTVMPEKGRAFELEVGQTMPILASMGAYTIKAEEESVVSANYKPLEAESVVISGFEAIRANLPAVQSQDVHLLTTSKAFRRGDMREPGTFRYEQNLLSRVSNGRVELFEVASRDQAELKAALQGLVKGEKDVNYVIQLTEDEFKSISDDREMAELLKNAGLMVLPNMGLTETRGVPFLREVESAGVILGNTTKDDIENKTAIAGWLKDIMSRLTGNKAIDWDMLSTLLKTPDPSTFSDRINILVKNLQVKLQPYKADEGVRERRQLLWSV